MERIKLLDDEEGFLKQENYELKKKISYSNVEKEMMKREKSTYEKCDQKAKFLENENRKLKARIESMKNKPKNPVKNSKKNIPTIKINKKEFENSLSFSF